MSKQDLDQLASDLADFAPKEKNSSRSAVEERVIAGFEEIQKFFNEQGHIPQHGSDRDIFERLYAVRLDRLKASDEYQDLLAPFDKDGLLTSEAATQNDVSSLDLDALADDLKDITAGSDLTELRHVRSTAEIRAAEEIANREPCKDFDKFKPLFQKIEKDLASAVRLTLPIRKEAGFRKTDIKKGEFFILSGQTAYVADVGEPIKAPNGQYDARLRVIYSNGTESDLLLRSLQRALYKDETSRMISDPSVAGPLFAGEREDDDLQSGTIYVLRSLSELPVVSKNRMVLHKIGVTGTSVQKRIANAKLDPTFLMADVEVVATYQLFNINRHKLEKIFHRIFGHAQLDVQIADRMGNFISPKEWFLVPLNVIDKAVEKIKDGSISDYSYDATCADLVKE
ncbi:MAG: hypothetical protein DHS20C08_11710 [Rhodomicrobium sp.]|nr:MAG: hypothetical protein DHS20C08_11710 [Rhodomicrobium sp.]